MPQSMTKHVNVYAQVAIRNINPPIYGTCKDIIMTTGDILKCLCKRARVEEILPNGSTVRLNMTNYYKDNGAGLYVKKEIEVKVSDAEPTRFKVPVAPFNKAQVVETKTEVNEDLDIEMTSDANPSIDDSAEVLINNDADVVVECVITDAASISTANTGIDKSTVTTTHSGHNNNHSNKNKKHKKH